MVKMTFTLDDDTVLRLRTTALRLSKPQSQVVREAVQDYAARVGRLSEGERLRLLQTFDEIVDRIPARSADKVDRELRELREARRSTGRRHSTGS